MIDPISPTLPAVSPVAATTAKDPVTPSRISQQTTTATEGLPPITEMGDEQGSISPEASQQIQIAKVQYTLAYVVLIAMNTSPDAGDPIEDNPLPDSFDKVQEVTTIRHIAPIAGNVSALHTPVGQTLNKTGAASEANPDHLDMLMNLLGYFSPEKTARRLLDVAASLFNDSEIRQIQGDTEASRRSFFERLGTSIDEEFKKIHQKWGKLPEVVQNEVDKTHFLIFSGLQTFAEKGIDTSGTTPESTARQKIATFYRDSAQWFDRLEKTFARGGYNTHGMSLLISTATFSKEV